jgi:hypothetical protein
MIALQGRFSDGDASFLDTVYYFIRDISALNGRVLG